MKTVIIEYNSDTFLPKEISKKFDRAIQDVINVRYEDDKINCIISKLRGDLIWWLAENGIIVVKELNQNDYD